MLTRYLNQKAELRSVIDTNNRGEPIYGEAIMVRCRKEVGTKEIITPEKQVIKAEYVYYLVDSVLVGDSIDGRRVQFVNPMTGLFGDIKGYEVVV